MIPDNDYIAFHNPFQNLNEKLLGTWDYYHYAELLSPGPRTASAFAEAFKKLVGQGFFGRDHFSGTYTGTPGGYSITHRAGFR